MHEFSGARERRLAAIPSLRTTGTAGFSLSPDASFALYSNADSLAADIMLAENFR